MVASDLLITFTHLFISFFSAALRLFPLYCWSFQIYIALFNYHLQWTHARAREFTILSFSLVFFIFQCEDMRTIRFVGMNERSTNTLAHFISQYLQIQCSATETIHHYGAHTNTLAAHNCKWKINWMGGHELHVDYDFSLFCAVYFVDGSGAHSFSTLTEDKVHSSLLIFLCIWPVNVCRSRDEQQSFIVNREIEENAVAVDDRSKHGNNNRMERGTTDKRTKETARSLARNKYYK